MTTRNQHRDQRLVIATYNVNNVRRRLDNLLKWLADSGPDIVCLQELKCRDNEFPEEAISKAGYQAVWRGEKSWNGVAILARNSVPILIRDELPGDPSDRQSRYIEAAISGIVVASIYAPNGNPQPGPKFDYKLAWMERLIAHAAELKATGVPVILAGDYNVAPADLDIYPTRSWDDDALIQPAPRRSFRRLVDQGWTDAIRHLFPDQRMYSFWTYWRGRFDRDHGLRLDHILLSADLAAGLADAGVDRHERGQNGASDHAPAWVALNLR